jgi:hypothetical protein
MRRLGEYRCGVRLAADDALYAGKDRTLVQAMPLNMA